MKNSYKEELFEETVEVIKETNDLVVYNDDFNSFEHVIITLMRVCSHTLEQAEQCSLIIHNKGKCRVKNGSFEDLIPMRQAICDAGINAEIE